MALLFSEAFESIAGLGTDFWPLANRVGSASILSPGRTNSAVAIPSEGETNAEFNSSSYLTFDFGPLGNQTNKKLYLGFASRGFKTRSGLSDGSFTQRQVFFKVLNGTKTETLSFEFEKNLDSDSSATLRLSVVKDSSVLHTFALTSIPVGKYFASCGSTAANTLAPSSESWYYFELEFDLTAATPTVKLWLNGLRLTTTDNANQFTVAGLTTIGGFQLHGSRHPFCRAFQALAESVFFDDMYISDNAAAAFNPQASTALTTRLGSAKVYSNTYSLTDAKNLNWSIAGTATSFSDALNTPDGNEKYAASNILGAELATRLNGPATLLNFERIAAIQMIYSASAAGSLPAGLMPIVDINSSASGFEVAAEPDVFLPEDGYKTKIVTVQTDPNTNAPFTAAMLVASGGTNVRRIGVKVTQANEP